MAFVEVCRVVSDRIHLGFTARVDFCVDEFSYVQAAESRISNVRMFECSGVFETTETAMCLASLK